MMVGRVLFEVGRCGDDPRLCRIYESKLLKAQSLQNNILLAEMSVV